MGNDDAPFAIGAFVPGCRGEYAPAPTDEGRWWVWFLDPTSRFWARFDYQPETRRWPVHQFGPRRLYVEVATAYPCWDQAGRPPVTQWRFTITPDGQRVPLAGITGHEHTPATSSMLIK
ncbi:MAG TPA: hypothetical protein VN748_11580 [Pseudonocardiaceae bacterium]|nr:hypothetical protein [Pseudonocardiaceae bacterium]